MSIRPEAAIVRRAGKVPRRDWIKNQMHIWQGRYVIGQLLEPARPCSFGGGDLHTRVDSRLRSKIFLPVFRSEKIRKCVKRKRKKEKESQGRRETTASLVFTKIFHYTREYASPPFSFFSSFVRILGHR